MKASDRVEFVRVMNGMASVFGASLTPEALDIWWSAFADWSLEEFKGTATAAVKRASFMPRPGDLMALRRAALPTAGESWAAVLKHLRGGYRSGGLTPEIDRAVAPLGGYRSLAMMPTDELHWQEKRFAEHYGDMAEAGETRESLANTPGWLQIQAHGAKALYKR